MPRDPLSAIDQIIQEARESGQFDDLEGKGKPLRLDTSPDAVVNGLLKQAGVVPEWVELATSVEKLLAKAEALQEALAGAHAACEAALHQDEVRPEPSADVAALSPWERCVRFLTRRPGTPQAGAPGAGRSARNAVEEYHRLWDRSLAEYAGLLHQANRKIRRFNQLVPLADRHRPLIPVEDRLRQFVERFPHYEHAPGGSFTPVPGSVPPALLQPPDGKEGGLTTGRDLQRAEALRAARRVDRRPPAIG